MQQYADTYLLLNIAVNKYQHTVASCWISSTYVLQLQTENPLDFYTSES